MLCVALMTVHKPTQETKNIIAIVDPYTFTIIKSLVLEMTKLFLNRTSVSVVFKLGFKQLFKTYFCLN